MDSCQSGSTKAPTGRRRFAGSGSPSTSGMRSRVSAPEQKPRPVPVSTTARTAGSSWARRQAAGTSSTAISEVSALSVRGRLSRMVATPAATE